MIRRANIGPDTTRSTYYSVNTQAEFLIVWAERR